MFVCWLFWLEKKNRFKIEEALSASFEYEQTVTLKGSSDEEELTMLLKKLPATPDLGDKPAKKGKAPKKMLKPYIKKVQQKKK